MLDWSDPLPSPAESKAEVRIQRKASNIKMSFGSLYVSCPPPRDRRSILSGTAEVVVTCEEQTRNRRPDGYATELLWYRFSSNPKRIPGLPDPGRSSLLDDCMLLHWHQAVAIPGPNQQRAFDRVCRLTSPITYPMTSPIACRITSENQSVRWERARLVRVGFGMKEQPICLTTRDVHRNNQSSLYEKLPEIRRIHQYPLN